MSRKPRAILCGLCEYFPPYRASPIEGRFLPTSLVPGKCRLVGSRSRVGGLDARGIPQALRASCRTRARGMTRDETTQAMSDAPLILTPDISKMGYNPANFAYWIGTGPWVVG